MCSARGGVEIEQSRCQVHTSHVAVVDLPPLSSPCTPSLSSLSVPSLVSHHSVRISAVFLDTVSDLHTSLHVPPLLSLHLPDIFPLHYLITSICGLLLPCLYLIVNQNIPFLKTEARRSQLNPCRTYCTCIMLFCRVTVIKHLLLQSVSEDGSIFILIYWLSHCRGSYEIL